MTRRDKCRLVGLRAHRINDAQAARAWKVLAAELEQLGERDLPKFRDVLKAIRTATIEVTHNVR